MAVAFEATNSIALLLPFLFPGLQVGHWNWAGKILAVAISLCWIRGTGLSRRQIGLCLPTGARGWAVSAFGTLLLGGLSTAERLLAGAEPFDAETIAFQATMPGLDEELAFRGLLFALLSRGLPSPRGRVLSAATVVILFWLVHVVIIRNGAILLTGSRPEVLLSSLIFMVLRLLTGSILVTIVAHNLDNVANVLA